MNHSMNGKPMVNPFGTPTRAIILGYYDGPTNGAIQFGDRGPVFRFAMPNEDEQLASNQSARTYDLSPLPANALDRIVDAIHPHITPAWPHWFPAWRFPSQRIEDSVTEPWMRFSRKRARWNGKPSRNPMAFLRSMI
jgi:hypothetical protein